MQEETSNTAAAPVETTPASEAPINAHMRWYILHAYSGLSAKAENRWNRACRRWVAEQIPRLIPDGERYESSNGTKYTASACLYPGYQCIGGTVGPTEHAFSFGIFLFSFFIWHVAEGDAAR